jgi:predicted RNA polymerase sigma factor
VRADDGGDPRCLASSSRIDGSDVLSLWSAILRLYDLLHARNASPVIAINRALVRAYAGDSLSAVSEAVELGQEAVLARSPAEQHALLRNARGGATGLQPDLVRG